jgi:TP901 family phage tail tape measure protein
MASTVFDLMVGLSLDDSGLSSGLDKVKSGLGGMVGGVAKVAAKATAAATTAVVGFTGTAVKVGMDFDSSMSQVYATMAEKADEMITYNGKTMKSSEALRDYAQQMGATTAFSASEAADALNYMALAGYDAEQSMSMLPNVLNLAAAGNMDLARASDMVTDASTAFGLSVDENGPRITQMVDEMAKAASTGNTSVEQLGDAFLVVGGLAQELNGGMVTLSDGTQQSVDGIQELEIALTAMANAGIKGGEAGTHMRNMLLKLSSPTSDGAKQMEALGVSVFDTEGNMRSLQDVFGDLNGALSNLTQEQKIQAISDLFNTRDLASAEALLNAVGQDWDSIGEAILDADGAAQKMADTQLDNLSGDIVKLKSAFEGFQIAVSDRVTPVLRKFVKFGTDGLSRLTEAFKTKGLEGAMEELGVILSEGLQKLVDGAPKLVKAAMLLMKSFAKGLMDNVNVILFAAGDIIEMFLQELVDSTSNGQNAIMEVINSILGVFEENYMQFMDMGMQILVNIMNGIVEHLPETVYYVSQIITHLTEVLTEYAPQLIEASFSIIKAISDGLIEALPEITPALIDLVTAIAEGILEHIDILLEVAITLVVALADALIENRGKLAEKGPELLQALIDGIKNSFNMLDQLGSDIINKFIDAIQTFLPNIIPPGMDFIINLIQGVKNAFDKLFGVAGETVDQFGKGIENGVTSKAETWGTHLMDAFISGIKKRHPILSKVVDGVAGLVQKKIGFSEPEEGPLSNFHTFAPDMMDLYAKGIKENSGKVTSALDNLTGDMYDTMDISTPAFEYAGGYGMINMETGSSTSGDYGDVVTAITDALMNMQLMVNIGNRPIEAMITSAQQKTTYRNGGR